MYRELLLAGITFALAGCAFGDDVPTSPARPAAAGSVAVVELFTSEGCSSCPPADMVLTNTADKAKTDNRPVIALEWHVDYWDRLGWADPFSSADATARQQKYAAAFHLDEIYTPQMIVNGRQQFIGSDAATAASSITSALSKSAGVRLMVSNLDLNAETLTADFSIDGTAGDCVLLALAVQRSATTNVLRGENGGRTLAHRNIVRASQTLSPTSRGKIKLSLPKGLSRNDVSIVAIIQDQKTMAIQGAEQASFQ